MSLTDKLGLIGSPFENYTAETEPKIAEYAVRPPYLQTIVHRSQGLSSFILFGDRGAGKSATRITVYNEIWSEVAKAEKKQPLVVSLTDFTRLTSPFQKGVLDDRKIVSEIAFCVIEQTLAWLSSLEEDERAIYIEALDAEERSLVLAMINGFYLSVPDLDRQVSTSEALRLLNSAWTTKSAVWMSKRWDAITKVFAGGIAALSKKYVEGNIDISDAAEKILKSLKAESPTVSRAILTKLVEFARAFGFSGVCLLVDKVDETPATSSSAEATARFIYPLLNHVQLLEIEGFSFVLFLWSNVTSHFNGKYEVRLDKIANAKIAWSDQGLRDMVEARVRFYSSGRKTFADFFEPGADVDAATKGVIETAVRSPRELIRLLDTIVREHDSRELSGLLTKASLDDGCDKYVVETIGSWYPEKSIQQLLRLGSCSFVNRDVQSKFKIGDQGARVKIQSWADAGMVRQDGTAPSELGGKPVYRFVVADPRLRRIIERKLDQSVGAETEDEDMSMEQGSV